MVNCKYVFLGLSWLVLLMPRFVAADEALHIVTSVKPLALIVKDLLGDRVAVDYLVPASADPHHYALKVSDRIKLTKADLVIWIGPDIERFLVSVVTQLPPEKVIKVAELEAIHWPKVGHSHDHHELMTGYRDPHLWLNPENAIGVQQAVSDWLLREKGMDTAVELVRSTQDLKRLDAEWAGRLTRMGAFKYAVYHDGYAHFVEHYGLAEPLVISPSSSQAPGARHLVALQQSMEGVSCMMVELANENKLTQQLSLATGVVIEPIDLLATASQIKTYQQLIDGVVTSFERCGQALTGM